MSDLALFMVGVVVSIPAATAILGLVFFALRDGRENDPVPQKRAAEPSARR